MMDPRGREICKTAIEDLVNYNRIVTLAEYRRDVERTTMDDLCGVLPWLRPERRWTLLQEP